MESKWIRTTVLLSLLLMMVAGGPGLAGASHLHTNVEENIPSSMMETYQPPGSRTKSPNPGLPSLVALTMDTLLVNRRLVEGGDFYLDRIEDFLLDHPLLLKSYGFSIDESEEAAHDIMGACINLHYRINPRVILVILMLVSETNVRGSPCGFGEWVDRFAQRLWIYYEAHSLQSAPPHLTLPSGAQALVPDKANSATYAVAQVLAHLAPSDIVWQKWVSREAGSFYETYGRLFESPLAPLSLTHLPASPFLYRPWDTGQYPAVNVNSWFDHHYPLGLPPEWSCPGNPPPDVDGKLTKYTGEVFDNQRVCSCNLGKCYDRHDGIDFALPAGAPAHPAANGTIVWTGPIMIDHGNGYYTLYGHLNENSSLGTGQSVTRNTYLGSVSASYNHLHFEVSKGWTPVTDPYGWCSSSSDPWAEHQNGTGSSWLWADMSEDCPDIDSTPPSISFSTPLEKRWYNTEITLTWTIRDPESGVIRYEWWWDNQPHREVNLGEPLRELTDSAKLHTAHQGKHTLYVKAWDKAGNPPSSASTDWFGYDTFLPHSPSISEVGCNARNNQWQNTCLDPSFIWSATDRNGDKGAGVSEYAYAWGKETSASSASWSTWSIATTYDPGPIGVVDGWAQYFLHVKSRDVAGNESSPATFSFSYDGTDPTIAGFSIDRGANTTNKTNVRLDVTASDTGSGVAAICVNADGGACSDWRSYTGGSLFWTLATLNHCTHILYVTVHDAARNRSEVVSDTIYMDLDPPMPHSANYRICQYVVNLGGLNGITSPHYSLVSAIGQPWATGIDIVTSTGFMEQAGFLSALMGCLPISYTYAPTLPIFITPTLPSSFEVSINKGEGFYTNNPVVEVKAPAPNVAYVRISNSSAYSDTEWQTYQPTTTWSISVPTALGGRYTTTEDYDYTTPHYIYVWFLDEWDNVYGSYFDIIFYDPIAPEGRVEILARGIDTVTLSLEAWDDNSGVAEMRISEAPTFEGLSWQPYEEVVDWILTGSGSVYVQFGDGAGNTSPVYVLELTRRIYLPVILKLSS
jgi:murein DD-endopeptidase MepM/ murein hydrolase activator NlpD